MSDGFLTTIFGGEDNSSSDSLGAANPIASSDTTPESQPSNGSDDQGGHTSHATELGHVEPMDNSANAGDASA